MLDETPPVPKRVILIVDDEDVPRTFLEEYLSESFPEYEIRTAENGMTALGILRDTKNIVILITDWRMPNMNGGELIRQIPEKKRPDTIILSGTIADIKSAQLDYNALRIKAVVQKPDLTPLREIITNILAKST